MIDDGLAQAREFNFRETLLVLLLLMVCLVSGPAAREDRPGLVADGGEGEQGFSLKLHREAEGKWIAAVAGADGATADGKLEVVASKLAGLCRARECSLAVEFADAERVTHAEAQRVVGTLVNALGAQWRLGY